MSRSVDTVNNFICPNADRMGERACSDRRKCWEPCGDLGKCVDQAVPADQMMMKRFEQGGPLAGGALEDNE